MENRVSKRKPVQRPARIHGPDRTPICACIVRDLSETGARLNFDRNGSALSKIPSEFILSFTPDELELLDGRSVTRKCRKVWSNENQLGAHFPDRDKMYRNGGRDRD